ncbi:hypothetical protein J3R08_000541 [Micromonospora sp. HB375]|uniref:hypothetical protein n=1 Tax=Micromonospora TaxID=1873 RepID=UPI001AE84DC2|nr:MULTISPECIES: hypothetical protein [unclassified Micromonospora]MBP1780691.1 hypothetical protein [Micromonospora sp. HB375]MDH6472179.1 hypothetical protein [Micromonospora sp. H404/HB375]
MTVGGEPAFPCPHRHLNSLTDDCTQLFAYVQLLGGDGGAELDVIGIDEAMIALQYTKRFLLQAQPSV